MSDEKDLEKSMRKALRMDPDILIKKRRATVRLKRADIPRIEVRAAVAEDGESQVAFINIVGELRVPYSPALNLEAARPDIADYRKQGFAVEFGTDHPDTSEAKLLQYWLFKE